MLELTVGALIGVVVGAAATEVRNRRLKAELVLSEAKYNSLKGFFEARVLAVKAKADEAKKRA